jgi:hypothetical protein
VIGNRVAAEASLRLSGCSKQISSEDGEAEYSSCEYTVPVLYWKGHMQLIVARGVEYTAFTEAKKVPAKTQAAFPEMNKKALKAHQEGGLVDMVVGLDNLKRQPLPVRGQPESSLRYVVKNLMELRRRI